MIKDIIKINEDNIGKYEQFETYGVSRIIGSGLYNLNKSINDLINYIDIVRDEASKVISGKSDRNINDIRYGLVYIEEFNGYLLKINSEIEIINFNLNLLEEKSYVLDTLLDAFSEKYDELYVLYDSIREIVFVNNEYIKNFRKEK